MVRRLLFAAVLAALAPARAQTPDSPEALATPQPGEVAELDLQSIKRFGDKVARFEVSIVRAQQGNAAPDSLGPRRVRYVADCEEQTLTLAAVGVFDNSGQVQRSLVVPPGAVDPVQPAKGSLEQKWLRKACMF